MIGIPLKDWDISINYGIKTGFNDAFIIDEAKRNEILAGCKTDDERKRTVELIRPILRGRDIKRYAYSWAELYVIGTFPALHVDIDKYPAVKKFLYGFYPKLRQTGQTLTAAEKQSVKAHILAHGLSVNEKNLDKSRKKTGNQWFETQDQIDYWDDFSKPKIVWAELARTGNAFTFNGDRHFVGNTGYILTMGEVTKNCVGYEWLLAFLNSKALLFYLDMICNRLDETGWRWLRQHVELLPVPIQPLEKQGAITEIIRAELSKTTTEGQRKINVQIANYYGLNREETEFLSSRFPHG